MDYETATSYELTVVVDDGTYASTEVFTVSVADVNEAPSLSATLPSMPSKKILPPVPPLLPVQSPILKQERLPILSGTGSENFKVSS